MKLLMFGLAVWRVSFFLVREDGPGKIARKVRELTGIEHDEYGEVVSYNDWTPLTCVFCTSIWASILMMLAPSWLQFALAGSAVAVCAEKNC